MSTSTILSDITITLKDLLTDKQQILDTQNEPGFNVECQFPGDEINFSQKPIVNLYLIRVEENGFAQNKDWINIGPEKRQYPPLALNLFYMVTPYAKDQLIVFRVLGEAIRILYDYAIVDGSLLKGSLEHTYEELKVDLCKFNLEELTRIWNAFNQPYRLSVCYQVRIAYIDSMINEKIIRVAEKENQHRYKKDDEETDDSE